MFPGCFRGNTIRPNIARVHRNITQLLPGYLQQMSDLIHFLLAGLAPAFGQALLCRHASDVIVKDELCGEYRQAIWSGATSMDCYVETTGVLFVTNHLDVLQKAHQFGYTPSEFL